MGLLKQFSKFLMFYQWTVLQKKQEILLIGAHLSELNMCSDSISLNIFVVAFKTLSTLCSQQRILTVAFTTLITHNHAQFLGDKLFASFISVY